MALTQNEYGGYKTISIPFDLELLSVHAINPERYPFLLETNSEQVCDSGFDILFAFPGERIESNGITDTAFFERLDLAIEHNSNENNQNEDAIPFRGGWFVFLSYELVGSIEKKLEGLQTDDSLPVAIAVRIPVAIIKNHKNKSCSIIYEKGFEACAEQILNDISSLDKMKSAVVADVRISEDEPLAFKNGVAKIKSYLKEGDTLQVNLSRQWDGVNLNNASYIDIYRSLSLCNPAPFAGLAKFGETVLCSSSPERLVSCSNNRLEMRPIAGTQKRDTNDTERDQQLVKELLNSAKENAEHIMLIDLIRNDMGKVCEIGSIKVDEAMVLESYAAVHHIVSNVTGQLQKGNSISDIIKAVFPGGTITGCPKVRCMEIINELEDRPRGAYTGSMGYINHNGDFDLNILIRTLTVSNEKIQFRAGAGIVVDSIADNELLETRHKAKALLKSLHQHVS